MSYSMEGVGSPSPKVPGWKPQIGEILDGEVIYVSETPYIKHDEPKYNPRNQTKATLKIVVGDVGLFPRTHMGPEQREVKSFAELDALGQPLLKAVPDNLMKAIAKAVRDATPEGQKPELKEGGRLIVKRVENVSTRYGDAHNFIAKYTPPAKGVSVDPFDVVGTSEQQPVTTPAAPVEEDPFA